MAWRAPGGFDRPVREGLDHLPDWRDAAAYAPLLDVERAGFAWEWLRRDPAYRAAAMAAGGTGADEKAARWGLHAFVAPYLAARSARPLWRRDAFGFVLEAEAHDEGPPDERLDLARIGAGATLLKAAGGGEHLLLSDGCRSLRIDILRGSLAAGPARLHYRLAGVRAAGAPLLVVRQLLALLGTGRFSANLHPPVRPARRWILALRAHDALAAGAGQREIAAALISAEAGHARWRLAAPSLRSRAQRLAREARHMASGGYLDLLWPPSPGARRRNAMQGEPGASGH